MAVVLNCGMENKQPSVRKKLAVTRCMEVGTEAFSEDRNGLTKLPLNRFIHGDQNLDHHE
jgi:hypothetical protein